MKYLSIVRYIMLIVSVLIVAVFMSSDITNGDNADPLFYWTYALFFISVGTAILLPLINLASNPQSAMRSLAGLAVVAIVVGIAYGMSDATPVVTHSQTYDNVFELRVSDTGLYTTYITFALAVVSIVGLEVYNMFK